MQISNKMSAFIGQMQAVQGLLSQTTIAKSFKALFAKKPSVAKILLESSYMFEKSDIKGSLFSTQCLLMCEEMLTPQFMKANKTSIKELMIESIEKVENLVLTQKLKNTFKSEYHKDLDSLSAACALYGLWGKELFKDDLPSLDHLKSCVSRIQAIKDTTSDTHALKQILNTISFRNSKLSL